MSPPVAESFSGIFFHFIFQDYRCFQTDRIDIFSVFSGEYQINGIPAKICGIQRKATVCFYGAFPVHTHHIRSCIPADATGKFSLFTVKKCDLHRSLIHRPATDMKPSGPGIDDLLIQIKLRIFLFFLQFPHGNPEPDVFSVFFHRINRQLSGFLPAFRQLDRKDLFFTEKTDCFFRTAQFLFFFPAHKLCLDPVPVQTDFRSRSGRPVSFQDIGIFCSEQKAFPFRSKYLCQHLQTSSPSGNSFSHSSGISCSFLSVHSPFISVRFGL